MEKLCTVFFINITFWKIKSIEMVNGTVIARDLEAGFEEVKYWEFLGCILFCVII